MSVKVLMTLLFATVVVTTSVFALKCVVKNTPQQSSGDECDTRCYYAKCGDEVAAGCLRADFRDCNGIKNFLGDCDGGFSCSVCNSADMCNKLPPSPPPAPPSGGGNNNNNGPPPAPPSGGNNNNNGPPPAPPSGGNNNSPDDGNGAVRDIGGIPMMLLALLPVVVWTMENF